MKTLYVSDLDGTLLNSKDRLSDYTVRTLNFLIRKGMCFSYATARSLSSAAVATTGLETDIPVIVYNGAFIRNAETGEVLLQTGFTEEEKATVEDYLNQIGIYPLVYAFVDGAERVSWLRGKENEGMRRYFSLRVGDRRFREATNEQELYRGDAFYFTCIGTEAELMPVYEKFKDNSMYRCTLQQELYREEYWCEIMPRKATKANAAIRLKTLAGCERIVSFGDAVNDIPLFSVSDECYAVGNAVPGLIENATGVIGSNDDDGVARWLTEHIRL